jgi:hypothetical protein
LHLTLAIFFLLSDPRFSSYSSQLLSQQPFLLAVLFTVLAAAIDEVALRLRELRLPITHGGRG